MNTIGPVIVIVLTIVAVGWLFFLLVFGRPPKSNPALGSRMSDIQRVTVTGTKNVQWRYDPTLAPDEVAYEARGHTIHVMSGDGVLAIEADGSVLIQHGAAVQRGN